MKKSGTATKKWQPTPRQRSLCQLLIDLQDDRTVADKLRSLKISDRVFLRWLQDDRFFNHLMLKVGLRADGEVGEVWKALIAQAKAGKVQAIKLFFEMIGKHAHRKQADQEVASAAVTRFREQAQALDPQLVRELFERLESIDSPGKADRKGSA